MLGKGLESLIPKKNQNTPPSPQSFSTSGDKATDSRVSGEYGEGHEGVSEISRSAALRPSGQGSARSDENEAKAPARTLAGSSSSSLGEVPRRQNFQRQESIFQIETDKIKPNPFQPRRDFNEDGLQELAQSIREFGIIQPLVVSKIIQETDQGTEVEYQLIAGERRLMAAKILGMRTVPAIVKKIDEHRVKLEMALIENLQRSDLNPVEEAKAYARLQDEFGLTQREIAARVGKSREAVANTLRLLNLPSHIQEALTRGKLNGSQARTLLAISNIEEQNRVFATLLSQKLSVRALQDQIQKPKIVDPESEYWSRQLEEKLGAPVKVLKRGNRGKMVIQFYSEEEWQGILEKLLGESNRE